MSVRLTEKSTASLRQKHKKQKWNSELFSLPIGSAGGLSLSADIGSRKGEENLSEPESWKSLFNHFSWKRDRKHDRNSDILLVSSTRSCDIRTEKAQSKCHTALKANEIFFFLLDSCGLQLLETATDSTAASYLQYV